MVRETVHSAPIGSVWETDGGFIYMKLDDVRVLCLADFRPRYDGLYVGRTFNVLGLSYRVGWIEESTRIA